MTCEFWEGDGIGLGFVQECREEWAEMSSRACVLQLKVALWLASSVPSEGQNSPLEPWCARNQ